MRNTYRDKYLLNRLTVEMRRLGHILRAWAELVAPHVRHV